MLLRRWIFSSQNHKSPRGWPNPRLSSFQLAVINLRLVVFWWFWNLNVKPYLPYNFNKRKKLQIIRFLVQCWGLRILTGRVGKVKEWLSSELSFSSIYIVRGNLLSNIRSAQCIYKPNSGNISSNLHLLMNLHKTKRSSLIYMSTYEKKWFLTTFSYFWPLFRPFSGRKRLQNRHILVRS